MGLIDKSRLKIWKQLYLLALDQIFDFEEKMHLQHLNNYQKW